MPTIHVNPDPCIACTTCTVFCPVAQATGEFLGPRMIGPALQRFRLLNMAEDNSLSYCSNCKNCDISCPQGVNIGMRNISLSTCGLVPKIDMLAEKKLQLTLSVSLHAPNNQIRSSMMPVNDAYPVEQLIQTVRRYQDTTGRRVSFEYSMVRGVNDSDACAKQLADLIRGMGAHVNLIPINPVDGSPYSATDAANVRRFQQKLESLGVNATVRRRLGSEISAACGQLRRDEMNGKA